MAVDTDAVTVTLSMPRRCAEWLDVKGARRRYSAGRAGKSPIVVELIEREMAAEQTPQEVKPNGKGDGKKKSGGA